MAEQYSHTSIYNITSFIVPWILGLGDAKGPDDARAYIKRSKVLNSERDEEVKEKLATRLFTNSYLHDELTATIGENVYCPTGSMPYVFNLEINSRLSMSARPSGVTKDFETVIMVDDFVRKLQKDTREMIEIKLLATMAVWGAKKGIYILSKMNNKEVRLFFDEERWNGIMNKVKLWADDWMKARGFKDPVPVYIPPLEQIRMALRKPPSSSKALAKFFKYFETTTEDHAYNVSTAYSIYFWERGSFNYPEPTCYIANIEVKPGPAEDCQYRVFMEEHFPLEYRKALMAILFAKYAVEEQTVTICEKCKECWAQNGSERCHKCSL